MSLRKRIFLKKVELNKQMISGFEKVSTASVSDVIKKNCSLNSRIQLVSSPKNNIMVGTALTVNIYGSNNLALHAAMEMAEEGDVIVVSNDGENVRAIMGEIMITYLQYNKKIAGIILDGAVRDIHELGKLNLHIYATGTSPLGPSKDGPGEVNIPIICGDLKINPGDIILADPDGIVVIPSNEADTILKKSQEYQKLDEMKVLESKMGMDKKQLILNLLTDKGFEFIDSAYRE